MTNLPERAHERISHDKARSMLAWNFKRGLIRAWILFTIVWLAVVGGVWLSEFEGKLVKRGQESFASMWTPDYDAICKKLRQQRASGGPVDPAPAIPALELVVHDGVGKVIAAPGRCLIEFAAEEGVNAVPVRLTVVGGDGSVLRQIQDRSGNLKPVSDFTPVARPQPLISDSDYRAMAQGLIFMFAMPAALLVAGWGFGGSRWASGQACKIAASGPRARQASDQTAAGTPNRRNTTFHYFSDAGLGSRSG